MDKVEGSGDLLALEETMGMATNNFPSIRPWKLLLISWGVICHLYIIFTWSMGWLSSCRRFYGNSLLRDCPPGGKTWYLCFTWSHVTWRRVEHQEMARLNWSNLSTIYLTVINYIIICQRDHLPHHLFVSASYQPSPRTLLHAHQQL